MMERDKTGEAKKKLQPVTDVLEKHGITDEALNKLSQAEPGEKIDPVEAMKPLLDQIKDKPAFYAELMTAEEQGGAVFEQLGTATLKDLKIDGGKATGKLSLGKTEKPIAFKKIGNGWKIDLTKMMK
jgi:hypothetical protein